MNLHCKETVAVIPARGGSKGLRGKNIKKLCGKPLIAYSIEAALKAELIDRVVVSTEDETIAAIAREWGAEVPFLRPVELAEDNSHISDALQYTLNRLYGQDLNHVIRAIMFPTSPFRTPGLIDFLVNQVRNGCSRAFTAKRIPSPMGTFFSLKQGVPVPLMAGMHEWGAFIRSYGVLSVERFSLPPKEYVCLLEDETYFVDIDTLEDFYLAEEIIRDGLFDFCSTQPPHMLAAETMQEVLP